MKDAVGWVAVAFVGSCLLGGLFAYAQTRAFKSTPVDPVIAQRDQLASLMTDVMDNQWSDSRQVDRLMDGADLNALIKSTKDSVIVSWQIPKAKGDSLRVNVAKNEIRLDYQASALNEKKIGGIYEKNESEERLEQILPLPQDAAAKTAKVTRDGDVVKVVFAKLQKSLT